MTRNGKSRIAILAGLGIVIVLLVWAFIASLPDSGSKEPETGEVILRTQIKDSFTLDDMLQKVGKENTSKSASLSGFDPVTEEPADTAGNEREIRRIQELIRDNERELGAGITVPVQQPVASRGKEKPALQEKKEEEEAALDREKRMQEAMLSIKKKFGKNAVLKGMNLQEGATAKDRNEQIGGHKA